MNTPFIFCKDFGGFCCQVRPHLVEVLTPKRAPHAGELLAQEVVPHIAVKAFEIPAPQPAHRVHPTSHHQQTMKPRLWPAPCSPSLEEPCTWETSPLKQWGMGELSSSGSPFSLDSVKCASCLAPFSLVVIFFSVFFPYTSSFPHCDDCLQAC